MTQSKAFEYLVENKEKCRVALGMLTSSEESAPIWAAFNESYLNLQQAISQGNKEEVTESFDRLDMVMDTIKEIKKA
tara:strand:+ start:1693 stop:1923 length:231 start_codon:yes stop_codon:yes gene_type:complete